VKYVCPSCEKIIFNRRLSNCEFCSAEIPEKLQLSLSEKERLDRQHQESLTRKSNRNTNSSFGDIGSIGVDFGDACGGE